jgi:hypothetical protein
MNYLRKIIFFSLLIIATGYSQTNYLLKHGDFENESNKWILRGNCEFSKKNVHAGKRALKISHSMQKENCAYVYLEQPTSEFEFTNWIYPVDSLFQTKIDLITNWDKSGANFICSLILNIDSLKIYTLKKSQNFRYKIDLKQWNKISIISDSLGYKKNVFINDSFCGSVNSGDNLSVEAIILGGLKCENCFGTIFYDDVSIENTNAKTTFWGNNIYWIQAGFASSFAGLGINLQVGHISGQHLFKVRYLNASEIRLVIIAVEPVRFDSPRESIQEISILYGRYYRNNFSIISIAAGIGYVDAVQRGAIIKDGVFKRKEIVKINLPIELTFKRIVSKKFGISVSGYAILNDKQSFFGATLGVQFGNLY